MQLFAQSHSSLASQKHPAEGRGPENQFWVWYGTPPKGRSLSCFEARADSGSSSGAPCFRMVISLYLSTFCVWYPQLRSLSVAKSQTPGLQGACIFFLRSVLLWLPNILGPPSSSALLPLCQQLLSSSCSSVSLPIVAQGAWGGGEWEWGRRHLEPTAQRSVGGLLGGISVPSGRFRPAVGLESRVLFAGSSEDVRLTSRS